MNDLLNINEYLRHYPALLIVLTTVGILLAGIAGQVIANKTSIPAIVIYLVFGIILGKYGLNVINPDVYGKDGLRAIIALSVAIIVFEGGMLIELKHLKYNLFSVLSLITANVFITILSMSFLAVWLLGLNWRIALLFASIVSVTGPTVIAPILRRLHVSQKVKYILETESVLVDAVGVITAASIFNFITVGEGAHPADIFNNIVISLVIGSFSGTICALGARYLIFRFYPLSGEITRLIVFSCTVSAYSLSELLSHESGIAAVAVAGLIIGNSNIPYKDSIKEFKGDLTTLSIMLVFIMLSASIDLSILFELGINGVLLVLILMFIIRPAGVFISTIFEKISWREKIFIASLGPRGIVAASAATFFSIELESWGFQGSDIIRSLVFLTILITVIVQGGGAKYMANLLNIAPSSVLIIGGGFVGKELALKMSEKNESIVIVESDEKKADALLKAQMYVINADASNEKTFRNKINISNIKTVIATSEDDWFNLRVCQIVKKLNPEAKLISIINDYKGKDVFENFGIKTVHLREAAVTVISNL